MKNIFSKKICLLNGFLSNVKPIILNYLNIDSLLETTNRNFEKK